jgi:hypothetical protein
VIQIGVQRAFVENRLAILLIAGFGLFRFGRQIFWHRAKNYLSVDRGSPDFPFESKVTQHLLLVAAMPRTVFYPAILR